MTRPTRADHGGRELAGSLSRPLAANRPSGLHGDEQRDSVRGVDRPAGTDVTANQPLAASWDPQPGSAPRRRNTKRGGRGRLARMLAAYGWRVYALPVLVAVTALAVLDVAQAPDPPASDQLGGVNDTPGAAPARQPLIPNPSGASGFQPVEAAAELPGGGPFTVQGSGAWRVVPGAGAPFGAGRLVTYTVEIEDGIEVDGGPQAFATTVDNTLNNPKSWMGSGKYRFQRIDDSRAADLRISLTSQQTTRAVCGFQIPYDASCWKAYDHRVVLNLARWVRGAVAFQGNVVQYDQYVVNHEVGHGLGFLHTGCPVNGQLAPVMMQQTWGVDDDYLTTLGTDHVTADGRVCKPNAWPFPTVD
ncbi:MAG: DUF3152 domain-containing protein [Pseudonocardiaceae bacterium]